MYIYSDEACNIGRCESVRYTPQVINIDWPCHWEQECVAGTHEILLSPLSLLKENVQIIITIAIMGEVLISWHGH